MASVLEFPYVDVIIAFGTFLGLAFGLHELNDTIEGRLLKTDDFGNQLTKIVESLTNPDKKVGVDSAKILQAYSSTITIKNELSAAGMLAFLSPLFALLPAIFEFTGDTALATYNGGIYLICSLLIVFSYSLNRIANRAQKRLPAVFSKYTIHNRPFDPDELAND